MRRPGKSSRDPDHVPSVGSVCIHLWAKYVYFLVNIFDFVSGNGLEDGRMDGVGGGGGTTPSVYNSSVPRSHSSASNSCSPPTGAVPSTMLVVPQPTRIADPHHIVTQNGSNRRYQCKMCPSVSHIPIYFFTISYVPFFLRKKGYRRRCLIGFLLGGDEKDAQ